MSLTVEERRIIEDFDRASAHTQKYLAPFLLQVQARGLMIESASRKLQAFAALPASSSKVVTFLDFAWTAVSTAVPALRLVSLVRKANIAEEITKSSAAAGMMLIQNTSPGKVSRITGKIGELKDGVEKGVGIYEKGQAAVAADTPAVEAFAKLDTTKGPVKELFEDARRMVGVWSRTIDFLVDQKTARLAHPTVAYKETLLSYATQRLPALEVLAGPELDMIESEYLWQMIAKYARENVEYSVVTAGATIHSGLNDKQREAIFDTFGPAAPRGRYFHRPFFFSIYNYLSAFGVTPRQPRVSSAVVRDTGHGRMRQ